MNDLLIEIQKKLYGQRNDKLSTVEINRLFTLPITSEFNLTLYRGFRGSALDLDTTLLQILPRVNGKEYLIPIALCLRFGADPNMYVNAPRLGIVHLLGYVYALLTNIDGEILNTIVLMLMITGSRPAMAMFDRKGGKIRSDLETPKGPTVNEWLDEQGYTTILDQINVCEASQLKEVVDSESLVVLSILLDKPDYAGRIYESKDMLLAIRAYSPIAFDKIPISNERVLMDYRTLEEAVNYPNAMAFDKLIKAGQAPSYLLINKILIEMRKYRAINHIIPFQELEAMLVSAIGTGTMLDVDQMNIVSSLGQDVLNTINKEYEQPYWRKVCKISVSKTIPERLRKLAISLNIDPSLSRGAICDTLSTLSKSDKQALKEAAIKRQQSRMSADLAKMNEFVGGSSNPPVLVCRNKNLLSNDPFDYNDMDLAYYRDDQGAIWCFGSDMFATLIENNVNPYNYTVLPTKFRDQLKCKLDILKRLGVDTVNTPETFSKALDALTEKDVPTSSGSLDSLIQLGIKYGVSADVIRSLTKDDITAGLLAVGYKVTLTGLSTTSALTTASRVLEYLSETNPEIINNFFTMLNKY